MYVSLGYVKIDALKIVDRLLNIIYLLHPTILLF